MESVSSAATQLSMPYPSNYATHHNAFQVSANSTFTLKSNKATLLVRCLIWSLIFVLLALSIASFMTWLILHPRVPNFHVNSFHAINFSLYDTSLPASYEMEVTIRNPNWKMNLYFRGSDVTVFHRSNELSETYIQPFLLRKRSMTRKCVKFATNTSNFAKKEKRSTDMRMHLSRKVMTFHVQMNGWVILRAGNWLSKQKGIHVFCGNLKVKLSVNATGNLISQRNDCLSYFLD